MAKRKPEPYESFQDNMGDAHALLKLAIALKNDRSRGMRSELRSKVGEALGIPSRERDQLDCLQSKEVFVTFLPNSALGREDFRDRRPLLRQALVAASAALETYVADKAMDFVGPAMRSDPPPRRMKDIALTVGHWIEIERTYERRGRGIRNIVEEHIRETSSTAPNRIAEVLSTVGVKNWLKQVDGERRVASGTTEQELTEITERRNRIAHAGDRQGRGRAALESDEVARNLEAIESIVQATESIMQNHQI